MSGHQIDYTLDLGVLGEQTFAVSYVYSEGYPDTRWEPGEPPSLEVTRVRSEVFGKEMCDFIEAYLNSDGYQQFCDQAWPDIEGEKADHYYQQWKDRRLEEKWNEQTG